jgi:hypothetical protein
MADPHFDVDGLHALCVYWAIAVCQTEVNGRSYEYAGLEAPKLAVGWANRAGGAFPTQSCSVPSARGPSVTVYIRALSMDTHLVVYAWLASAPALRRTVILRYTACQPGLTSLPCSLSALLASEFRMFQEVCTLCYRVSWRNASSTPHPLQ